MFARAFINESECNFVKVNYNDVDTDDNFCSYLKDKFNEA